MSKSDNSFSRPPFGAAWVAAGTEAALLGGAVGGAERAGRRDVSRFIAWLL